MADGRIKLGQIAFVEKGVYDVAATYKRFNFVMTVDSTYLSLVDDNVDNPVTDPLSWLCLANGKPATEAALKAIEALNRAEVVLNEAEVALKDSEATLKILTDFLSANANVDGTINTWKEIENFLNGVTETDSLLAMLLEQRTTLGGLIDGKAATGHAHTGYAATGHAHAYLSSAGGTVSGWITAAGFTRGSDERLKQDVKPISDDVLNKVVLLRPVEYNLKSTGENAVGFIAQEVEKIFSNTVMTDEEGMKSLDYDQLQNIQIAYLMREINELKQQIKELRDGTKR